MTFASENPELSEGYHQKVEMSDGIYSGYMKGGKRHGLGSFVDKDATYRMEGKWVKDSAFVGIGLKEFSDGTIQKGKFVEGKFKSDVSLLTGQYRQKSKKYSRSMESNHVKLEVMEALLRPVERPPQGAEATEAKDSRTQSGTSSSL